MRKIEIEQSTFKRLQSHAERLVDTPDSVINRAIDALEKANPSPADQTPERTTTTSGDAISLDANDLPDVTHTKVLRAMVGGRSVKPNWNNVAREMLRIAADEGYSVDKIQHLSRVKLVAGVKKDKGYHHVPQMRTSYQGLSAKRAAAASVALAKDVGIALELEWNWPHEDKALRPGRRTQLRLPGREAGG